jgi:DNA-directed RNA polymerase subunit alpha
MENNNKMGWICPQCEISVAPHITFCCKKNHEAVNNNFLDRDVSDFFTVRTRGCLEAEKIYTINDLINKHEYELKQIPNFGKKSLKEVKDFLSENDLCLKR